MPGLEFSFFNDPLSWFFVAVILTLAIPSLLFSYEYLKGKYSARKLILGQAATFAFVIAMLLVVTVRHIFVFLIFWELMSLLSYFLILFEKENERSVLAGTIYLVMTHVGTAFLAAAFFLIYKYTGAWDILAVKPALASLPLAQKNLLFIFLLAGFGAKAGIVPLHIWLPYAHPQAPSHVSSLMSGVMIKTAIYGMLRFIFFLLGAPAPWWGALILVLAAVSSLVGVLYALIEHDLKTLLAYHSVENIGIILFGVGAAMLFSQTGLTALSVLALAAGLYHLVNHAIFKGLLFLGAGSVYKATGTRDIEKLGGLIHNMPWTALFFLVGAMSISALPPFNGFVSEWLTMVVLFLGAMSLAGGLKILLALCAAALALTGGLAAACFVKAFGITFLARPRSHKAELAKEVPISMNLASGFLALLCLLLGLGAPLVLKPLMAVAGTVTGAPVPASFSPVDLFVFTPQPGSVIHLSPVLILILLAAIGGAAFLLFNLVWGRSKQTVGQTWDCGYYRLTPVNEYTATAFSKPFRIAFSFFLQPYRKIQAYKESHYHIRSLAYETRTKKIFGEFLYAPFVGLLFNSGKLFRKAQPGSIHLYLGYIFATLIVLLLFVRNI